MKVIIGADGGASTTSFIAIDLEGREIAKSISSGINYNFIDLDEAINNLLQGIKDLKIDNLEILGLSIGNPGKDDLTKDEKEEEFLNKIKAAFPYSFPIFMKSDAFMPLYGLLKENESGALLISGTGSMGIGVDEREKIYIVGGWGKPTNDDGSAYDIGVKALEEVFKYADGIGGYTSLVEKLLEYFQVKEVRDLIPLLNSDRWGKKEIAGLSKIVAKEASAGDAKALYVLDKAIESLSSYGISLIEKIGNEACVFGIYGGVFENNSYVREAFEKKIRSVYPKVDIRFPDMKAEKAAALYALRRIK